MFQMCISLERLRMIINKYIKPKNQMRLITSSYFRHTSGLFSLTYCQDPATNAMERILHNSLDFTHIVILIEALGYWVGKLIGILGREIDWLSKVVAVLFKRYRISVAANLKQKLYDQS